MAPELFIVFILLHIVIILAVTLGIGFWLITSGLRQEGWIKILGMVFGWLIIGLSLLSILATGIVTAKYLDRMHDYRMHPMMMHDKQYQQRPCPNCPYEEDEENKGK